MKKKGFTLAEILISLCIIGVIGALMATAFNHAKPDSTKMMYLKAYDSLVQVVQYLTEDKDIYSPIYTVESGSSQVTYDVTDYPLLNLNQPDDDDYNASYTGRFKFGYLLADLMKVNITDTNTNTNTISFRSGPGDFTWTVAPQGNVLSANQNGNASVNDGYANLVTLQIGDDREFSFCVQPNGVIDVMDSNGATFLRNRKNVRRRHDTAQTVSQTSCTASYSITLTDSQSFKIQDSNNNNDDNKNCKNLNTEKCCDEAGGIWDGTSCDTTGNSDPEENKDEKECKAQHGHWYNDTCYKCNDDETWDETACVKKNDSDPDENEEEAKEEECKKLNGHWYNDTCYTCKDDEEWNETACVKNTKLTEEEEKADICRKCRGIWVGDKCLNSDTAASKPCACYEEKIKELQNN